MLWQYGRQRYLPCDTALRKALKEGAAIRQAFRLTGIGIGVISGFVNG